MSKARAKGTAAESALCDYLRPSFPYVERRALRGTSDLCDIAGIPGAVIEVKNCREWRLSEWLRATVAKALPSRSVPFVVVKAPGKGTTRVGEWFAVTDVATMARLLADTQTPNQGQSYDDDTAKGDGGSPRTMPTDGAHGHDVGRCSSEPSPATARVGGDEGRSGRGRPLAPLPDTIECWLCPKPVVGDTDYCAGHLWEAS